VGFDVNSPQWGITPLAVKSWPIEHSFFRAYFVETDFVFRFNRPISGPATNPFTPSPKRLPACVSHSSKSKASLTRQASML